MPHCTWVWRRASNPPCTKCSRPTPRSTRSRAGLENLWLAGSHINLAAAEVELAGVVGREMILRDKLVGLDDRFDFLLSIARRRSAF